MALTYGKKMVLIVFFLTAGTLVSYAAKCMFETESPTSPVGPRHKFEKPWAQVFCMFFSMCFCGPILFLQRTCKRRRGIEQAPLTNYSAVKVTMTVAVPAICDLLASFFQNVALVYISVSIWQMLRGSICVFSAIQRRCYLGHRTKRYEWVGIWLVVMGLLVDGLAAIWVPGNGGGDEPDTSMALTLMAVFLVFLAQATQAFQTVVEEKLLHEAQADDLLVVFLEGAWGLVLTVAMFMPIAQALPGKDGSGVHENVWPEEPYMLFHSPVLFGFALVFIFSALAYNVSGMILCNATEATTRNIIDAGRTLCIWILALILEPIAPAYGEKLGWWTIIEFVGFAFLTVGMFIYYKVISLPCLREEDDARTVETSLVTA